MMRHLCTRRVVGWSLFVLLLATAAELCRIDHAGAEFKAIAPDGGALILY